jgi:hypothetical protein
LYTRLPHEPRWGYVCGRIAAIEERRVSREALVQALNLPAFEAIGQFCTMVLAAHEPHLPESAPWYDRIDSAYRTRIYDLREDSPEPEVADLFLLAGEYLNLGRGLRGEAENLFNGGEVPDVVALGGQAHLARLPEAVQSMLGEALAAGEPSRIAMALDSAYLHHQLALARKTGSAAIVAWVLEWVMAQCVSSLFRLAARGSRGAVDLAASLREPVLVELLRRFTLSAGTDFGVLSMELAAIARSLSALPPFRRSTEFERLATGHLLRSVAVSRSQTAGPERVFGFLFGLMVEQRNVRLLLWGRTAERPLRSLRLQLCFADEIGVPDAAGPAGEGPS